MNSLSASTVLFVCVVSVISAADAYNMGDRHDVDFMYRYHSNDDNDTVVFFPVIWDVRNTYFVLRDYYSSYGIGGNAWNDLDDLFAEAFDAGVSVVDCRSEIPRMSDRLIIDGPSSTDAFVITARLARDYGLHLIAGGFSNTPGITFHNNKVLEYLDEYRTYETSTVGKFIGVLGFDEPDARFEGPGWNQCQRNQEWYDLVVDYGDMLRDSMNSTTMIYPYATFLDRYRTEGPGGTPKYWQTTIPLFCGLLDAPVLDMYPCFYDHIENITFTDQIEFNDEDIILGSTDLLPSESMYYDAYATQDEIFSVDGNGYLHIYEFINETSHTDTLTVSQHGSDYDLGTVYSNGNGPVWAASDFRATDAGNRDAQGTEHRLNGALVFLDSTDPDNNLVVLHDGTDLTFEEDELSFPAAATIPTTACVGEFNYPVHYSTEASRKGLIGCGELRILVTYQKTRGQETLDMARVYAWDWEGNEGLVNVTAPGDLTAEIELDIVPDGVIWGIFWPTHNYWNVGTSPYPDLYSGFIVYDEQGNYQAVFEDIDHGTKVWEVIDYFEEDGIFPLEETSFISRRNAWFPVFCAGADYICNVEPCSTTISKIELDFSTGIGTGNTTHQLAQYTSDPIDLPGDYTVNDLNDAGAARFFKWGFHDDALLVSLDDGSGGSVVYRSTGAINFYGQNGIDLSFGTKEDTDYWEVSSGTPILTAPRVYDVRQPYRVPMLLNMAGYDKLTLLVSDIDVTTSSDRLAELDLAVDRFFELGIEDTDRQNTLIHHIRCAGRGEEGWPTFYASEDTLLYEACCDIVHGARGIHLRALDFALMCGNGGSSVPVGVFRAPDLLLNWAPSIETTNTDMISRIHSVIETLSGPGTDPDIFSILVDDSYTALDTNYVMNAEFIPGTGWRQDDDPWLNFIALEKTCAADSIEIVLLVVNDYETYADGIIRFPEYDEDDCTLEYIAGFELIYSLRSETMLALDFGLMPAYTASLYRITYEP